MDEWDYFYLSPEFWIVVTPLAIGILLILLLVVRLYYMAKISRGISSLVKIFKDEGELNMSIFSQVVNEANVDEANKNATNGNYDLRKSVIASIYGANTSQNTGLAQLISLVTLVESAQREQGEVEKVINEVKEHLAHQQNHYDKATQEAVLSALNNPAKLIKELESIAKSNAEPDQLDNTNSSNDSDVVEQSAVSDEKQPSEVSDELTGDQVRSLITENSYPCLKRILNGGQWSIGNPWTFEGEDSIPNQEFSDIFTFFNSERASGRLDDQGMKIYHYLVKQKKVRGL